MGLPYGRGAHVCDAGSLGQAAEGGNAVGYFFIFLAMSIRRGCLQ
jgi:hypothetical protein